MDGGGLKDEDNHNTTKTEPRPVPPTESNHDRGNYQNHRDLCFNYEGEDQNQNQAPTLD